ncbi:type IV secretory system conjugative DNA transfer family protein [Glutamicibacter bergerei]|uniref:Type IV secretory system conjugative DNA transfer family protein n=1 Tax=Glutamicibacter bergerei TaxID=256702 RepID=A0ABV9ML88_9MICC|nr:protein, TraG family [Micrococcaceae bacterium]
MASTQRESSFTTFLIIAVLAGIVLDALNWGEKITPTNSKVSWNPLDLLEAGLDGDLAWPSASWFILGGFVFVLIAGYVLITELWISPRKDTAKFNPQGAAITSMMGFTAAWHKARQIYGPSVTRKNAEAFIALAVYTNVSKKVPLYIQLEDSLWVYAPARGGKTSSIVVPMVLGAPGPVLATSTKPDVVAWTATAREKQGQVFVCDWEDITGWPQKVKWTPIYGCEDEDEALERGKAWANAAPMEGTKNGSWFSAKAGSVLGRLLHAAALEDRTMDDLLLWIFDSHNPEPITILEDHHKSRAFIQPLRERTESRAGETEDSIKSTLLSLAEPLVTEKVLSQFRFRRGEAFDINTFLEGPNTLHIVVDGEKSPLGTLSTMFADQVYRAARRKSSTFASGRLWPVFRMVLDEAPNVAAFSNMAELITDTGGRGIQVIGISQSFIQNEARWGKEEAKAIESNASLKLIFPGINSEDLKTYASDMGVRDKARISHSSSKTGGSRTTSTEEKAVVRAEELKHLRFGQATAVYRNLPPHVVHTEMVWQRKDHKHLKDMKDQTLRTCGKVFLDADHVGAEVVDVERAE